jgi:osmotically-inducible protein OsmY
MDVFVLQKRQSPMIDCAKPEQLTVTASSKSDRTIQLALRLERRLQCEMQLNVRVHVFENQLQLLGLVNSWYHKQQAQEIAREIAPEYRVRNDLRVDNIR